MTPAEIMNVLKAKNQMLTQKNDEYIKLAEKRAETEKDYKIKYAQRLLAMKGDYPATILREVVNGDRSVAELKFQYEVAAAVEKACLESMKDIREAIGAARSILTWLREEKGNG